MASGPQQNLRIAKLQIRDNAPPSSCPSGPVLCALDRHPSISFGFPNEGNSSMAGMVSPGQWQCNRALMRPAPRPGSEPHCFFKVLQGARCACNAPKQSPKTPLRTDFSPVSKCGCRLMSRPLASEAHIPKPRSCLSLYDTRRERRSAVDHDSDEGSAGAGFHACSEGL